MIYRPNYKRFQFSLHMAFEKKKFYGRQLELIPKHEWAIQKFFSILGSFADKVAEENFDVVISGSDCLLALCQAYLLQEKGYRVLIYPNTINDEKIDFLVRGYSELESDQLIGYIYKKVLNKEKKSNSNLVDLVIYLSKTISSRSGIKEKFPQVLIVGGQKYFADKDWTSFHKGKPMLALKDNESVKMTGIWEIPLKELDRFVQNYHISESGYLGVSDACILTFDHIFFNTRPDFNMNIDDDKHSAIYFSDAKNQVESRLKCSAVDRIKDLSEVVRHLSKEFPGE